MNQQGSLHSARLAYSEQLKESLKQIVESLSSMEAVERISLFGSYARGRSDLFTDLDILVVMDTDLGFVDRLLTLYALLSVSVDMDLLCYTPQEFAVMRERPFLKRILRDEEILYEKGRA